MVETPSRATAGAHYTPKSLATEVVQHALEPLVYDPGPHQQVDGWVPVDSDRILELKVADIACGSGAFLVAAARYLADRLVEAWDREEAVTGLTPAELKTPRDPHGHRHVPVRRGHQRDGRGDVQAVAVAGVAGPEAPVLLR